MDGNHACTIGAQSSVAVLPRYCPDTEIVVNRERSCVGAHRAVTWCSAGSARPSPIPSTFADGPLCSASSVRAVGSSKRPSTATYAAVVHIYRSSPRPMRVCHLLSHLCTLLSQQHRQGRMCAGCWLCAYALESNAGRSAAGWPGWMNGHLPFAAIGAPRAGGGVGTST